MTNDQWQDEQAKNLLKLAAWLIQGGGFVSGVLAVDARGQSVYPTSATAVAYGIDGALTRVLAGTPDEVERRVIGAAIIACSAAMGTANEPYSNATLATESTGMTQGKAVEILLDAVNYVGVWQEADRMVFEPGWTQTLVADSPERTNQGQ